MESGGLAPRYYHVILSRGRLAEGMGRVVTWKFRTSIPGLLGDHGLKNLPDILRDFRLSLCGWVDAVGLVEGFVAADSFEEVGDEGGLGFLGGFGEEGFEFGGEGFSHVVGHLHAGDEDGDFGVFGAGFGDDAEQVFLGFLGGNAAEAVVAAEGDDEDVGSFSHGPGDAAEAAGGGVAADAGVGDGVGEFGGVDFFLEEGRVGFARIEAVTGGDAVAEDDDALGRGVCFRSFFCH